MFWLLAIFSGYLTTLVSCGCYEKQFCCVGRNLSCVSTESDNFNQVQIHPHRQRRSDQTQRLNDRLRNSFQKRGSKAKKSRNSFNTDDKGFFPVIFEPEFEDNSEELIVSHFGLFEEPENEQSANSDNVEYYGPHKEIRYVIINDKPSKEKVGHLKSFRSTPSTGQSQTCYCDETCHKFVDCCSDYTTFCPLVDCQVTEWSGWSICQNNQKLMSNYLPNNNCGPGISKRIRSIVTKSQNGGAYCPRIVEEKACFNVDDSCDKRDFYLDDVALLLPYNFGTSRIPGYRNKTYFDLPKDIFEFKKLKNSCVIFRSVWFNFCEEQSARSVFLPNAHVCVECQPTAYLPHSNGLCKGEGSTNSETHWSLINVKTCFGQWIQIEKQDNCNCEKMYPSASRFIFV